MTPEPGTVLDLLERASLDPTAGIRVADRHEAALWRSWAEIRDRAREACGALQALGVGPGQAVGLVYPTGFAFLEAFLGALLAGAVPTPLYPPARLGRLDEYNRQTAGMLRAAGARLVLADPRAQRVLGATIEAAGTPLGCRRLDTLPRGAPRPAAVRADDLGLLQFSSGTTVDPKPVALSHRALLAQARLLGQLWPDRPDRRHTGLSWLPLYHDMGLIGFVLSAMERPSVVTLLAPEAFVTRPALWLRGISRHGASISCAPNFAYALCTRKVRDEDLEGVDLSGWEVAICGAETVVPEAMRAFASRFARWGFRAEALTPVYGLSEAALAVTFSDPWRAFVARRFDRAALAAGRAVPAEDGLELASVGRPLAGFEVEIADRHDAPLPAGQVGRVLVRGPSLMTGYLGRPEATARALRRGWLDTGDRGFLADGELYLAGREKDLIIVNGRNHAPDELERAVEGLPGARPGCVVAVGVRTEQAETEEVWLLVEHSREASAEARAALPRLCTERVLAATGLRPARVVLLSPGTLPRTSSGKLRRRAALDQLQAGQLVPPRAVTRALLAGALARSTLGYLRHRLGRRRRGA